MSKTETVYDSTDLQLRSLGDIVPAKLTLDDLAKPEMVQLIIERHMISLTDLKNAKREATELRDAIKQLTEERERLRIDLAKSEQRQSILWLEIPMGVLSGFAINMLTTDFANGLGWALLIMSLLMLLLMLFLLRLPQRRARQLERKKNDGE